MTSVERGRTSIAQEAPGESSLPGRAETSHRYLKWLPLLLCALPSLLLLAFVPPTFNEIDSAALLTSSVGYIVPHWPPLYPFFLFINTCLLGFTDTAIYSIVIVQHIIAVSASFYLCTAVSGTLRRVILAIFTWAANYFFVISHGIFTEALSTPFLLFYIGAALRLALHSDAELEYSRAFITVELLGESGHAACKSIVLAPRTIALAVGYVSLVLMTLARHNMFIFAALLPCLYIWRALLKANGSFLKPFVVSLVVALFAFITVHEANELVCKLLGSDSRPLYGRVVVYRLHELPWDTMPQSEKVHLLSGMLRRCPDNMTRVALLIMIRDNNPWIGSYKKVQAFMKIHGIRGKTVDQCFNDAGKAFYMTPNKYLLVKVAEAFQTYMGENNCAFGSFVESSVNSISGYRSGKIETSSKLRDLHLVQQMDPNRYRLIARVIPPSVFDGVCRYMPLGLLAISLSLIGVLRKAVLRESLAFILALWVCLILYSAISGAVTVVICRYLAPVNLGAWIMLAVSLASWRIRKASN